MATKSAKVTRIENKYGAEKVVIVNNSNQDLSPAHEAILDYALTNEISEDFADLLKMRLYQNSSELRIVVDVFQDAA